MRWLRRYSHPIESKHVGADYLARNPFAAICLLERVFEPAIPKGFKVEVQRAANHRGWDVWIGEPGRGVWLAEIRRTVMFDELFDAVNDERVLEWAAGVMVEMEKTFQDQKQSLDGVK